MTGVGFAAGATEVGDLRLEVRAVNGRSLAVKLRLCSDCAGLEAATEDLVRRRLQRGTVTVVAERSGGGMAALPSPAAMRRIVGELRALARELDLPDDLGLRDVVQLANTLLRGEPSTSRPAPAAYAALVEAALDDLQRHRQSDGQGTVAAMQATLQEFAAQLAAARARAPQLVAVFRDRLQRRLQEFLAQQGVALQPADLIREVALYADRTDVSEELQRLGTHLDQVHEVLRGGGEVGRRLEFLLQELLRETNTLGSKSPDAELAHVVVAMKSCIDKLKEQAANLE